MPPAAAPIPPEPSLPADLLPALLDLLPTGVVYCTPGPGDAAAPAALVLSYLNSAARQLLGPAAAPGTPLAACWPGPAGA
ncbi:hypothetical protein Q5H93_22965, partial [Hymenobacter sp. ASUV-10]